MGANTDTIDVLEAKVIQLIKDIIDDPESQLNGECNLQEVGIDSIKFMNVLIGIEEIIEENLEDIIDEIDLSEIMTIQNLVDLIWKLKAS